MERSFGRKTKLSLSLGVWTFAHFVLRKINHWLTQERGRNKDGHEGEMVMVCIVVPCWECRFPP